MLRESLERNKLKKIAGELSAAARSNTKVRRFVEKLKKGMMPSKAELKAMKVNDDVTMAFAKHMGPEKTMQLFEAKFSVDIDGFPRFYMDADTAAEVKIKMRKLIKKATMLKSVDRTNDAKIRQALRDRISGKDKLSGDDMKKEELDMNEGSIKGSDTSSQKGKLKKAFRRGEADQKSFNTPGGMPKRREPKNPTTPQGRAYKKGRQAGYVTNTTGKARSKPQDSLDRKSNPKYGPKRATGFGPKPKLPEMYDANQIFDVLENYLTDEQLDIVEANLHEIIGGLRKAGGSANKMKSRRVPHGHDGEQLKKPSKKQFRENDVVEKYLASKLGEIVEDDVEEGYADNKPKEKKRMGSVDTRPAPGRKLSPGRMRMKGDSGYAPGRHTYAREEFEVEEDTAMAIGAHEFSKGNKASRKEGPVGANRQARRDEYKKQLAARGIKKEELENEEMQDESFKNYTVTHAPTGKKYKVTAMHSNDAKKKASAMHGGSTASKYSGTNHDDFHTEAMDPVNSKQALKKFKLRKDKDIDNDGDVDGSDEYLHKRRKAIAQKQQDESGCGGGDKKKK